MRASELFELQPDIPTVFLFGGSQGSEILNKNMSSIAGRLDTAGIQVLWQTGSANFQVYKKYDGSRIRVLPFIDNIPEAYALADLVVARAGALTLSELTVCAKPSILIPLPGAAGDHQTKNAQTLSNHSAAVILAQKELSSELLLETITELMRNENERSRMAENAKSMGKYDATERIVQLILEIGYS